MLITVTTNYHILLIRNFILAIKTTPDCFPVRCKTNKKEYGVLLLLTIENTKYMSCTCFKFRDMITNTWFCNSDQRSKINTFYSTKLLHHRSKIVLRWLLCSKIPFLSKHFVWFLDFSVVHFLVISKKTFCAVHGGYYHFLWIVYLTVVQYMHAQCFARHKSTNNTNTLICVDLPKIHQWAAEHVNFHNFSCCTWPSRVLKINNK